MLLLSAMGVQSSNMTCYRVILVVLLCLSSISMHAQPVDIDVLVEKTFYPIVIDDAKQTGMLYEFVEIVNSSQSELNFVVTPLPVLRFLNRVKAKRFDVLFLMSDYWLPSSTHKFYTKSKFSLTMKNEIYALKDRVSNQAFFNDLNTLTKAGVLGYSYKFANYNNDQGYLAKEHLMTLVKHEDVIPKMIISKRVDVGIFSNLAYFYFKKSKHVDLDLFYKSNSPDGVYQTHLLVKKGDSKVSADKINRLLESEPTNTKISNLLEKYGIPLSAVNTSR